MNMLKKIVLSLVAGVLIQGSLLNATAQAANYSLMDATGKVLAKVNPKLFAEFPQPWRVTFVKDSNGYYYISFTSAANAGPRAEYETVSLWSSKRKPHMPITLNMGKNNFINITKEGSMQFEPAMEALDK